MKDRQASRSASKGQTLPASPVLTIEEVAALLRTTNKTVRKAARDGELASFKLGRITYILREPLERQLKTKITLGRSLRRKGQQGNPSARGDDM